MKPTESPAKRPAGQAPVWQTACVCVFLALAVLAVFGQTARFEFVNFDDNAYVYDNPMVERGLTWKGALWALTYGRIGHWHPLTWLTHMADCQAYGLWAGGHHLTNVALHAAAATFLFLALRKITGTLWRSAFVAAVFALHPLRAESVAWIAERKDVLSGMFFMLTLWAYADYARQPSRGRYAAVALLYGLGLLCKNMLVTLPFVMLLLDWWPLGRLKPGKATGGMRGPPSPGVGFWLLVKEKIPLLLLSAGSCVATALVPEQKLNFNREPVLARVGNALVSYVVYLRQMFFPEGLAVPYPFPHNGLPAWEVWCALLLLAGVSAGVAACRKKRPYLLMGWLWYLGMLVPAIGIVQISYYAHADRYTYLPEIGLAMAGTWAVADWSAGWKHRKLVLGGLMLAVVGALGYRGYIQTSYWRDNKTLWTRALACTSGNNVAHNNLGYSFAVKGVLEAAIAQYQKALEIEPGYADAQNNLCRAFILKGDYEPAIAQYRKALEIMPDDVETRNSLGAALYATGDREAAIAQYRKALEIKPDYAEARNGLGAALYAKGEKEAAIAQYRQALETKPDYAEAIHNLGSALASKGEYEAAIAQYRKALEIKPDYAEARNNLGNALLLKGDLQEAIAQYQKASQLSGGGNAMILRSLAAAYAETGSYGQAADTARRALELAKAQKNDALAAALQKEIKLYEANTTARDAPR